MNIIKGLSKDPAKAYEQGRRDGRAEVMHCCNQEKSIRSSVILREIELPNSFLEIPNFYMLYIAPEGYELSEDFREYVVYTHKDLEVLTDVMNYLNRKRTGCPECGKPERWCPVESVCLRCGYHDKGHPSFRLTEEEKQYWKKIIDIGTTLIMSENHFSDMIYLGDDE